MVKKNGPAQKKGPAVSHPFLHTGAALARNLPSTSCIATGQADWKICLHNGLLSKADYFSITPLSILQLLEL